MICHDLLSLKKPRSTSEGLKLRIGEDIRCTCHVSFFVSGNDHLSNPNKSNKMQKLFGHPSIHPLHLTKKETTTASLRVWQFSKGLYDLQKSKISDSSHILTKSQGLQGPGLDTLPSGHARLQHYRQVSPCWSPPRHKLLQNLEL